MTWDSFQERVRARMFRRRDAYRAVFTARDGDLGPMAEVVMQDLSHYCHVRRTSFKFSPVSRQSDALAMAFCEGQRDVFNRIVSQLQLTNDQIDRIAYTKEQET